jgi:hypothetical protein
MPAREKRKRPKAEGKAMRRAKKKQAEALIRILEEAQESFRKSLDSGKLLEAMELLEYCQGEAIELGGRIEEAEGEGTEAVALLEEYCEVVYRFHEELAGGKGYSASRMYRGLKKLLVRIENEIKYAIKERTEAVFLPYKASMWDSLDSVWRAADADPDCDAYVVPIPYYDKTPDGKIGQIHFEIGEYPKDVPVVDYREYDFEKRRADYIFIHNPYDNNNYITSVLPCFYSTNLKKNTDCLVYIPYFILNEIEPEMKRAAEKIEHFCLTPGVLNADKVIVQSEAMRRIYVDVLTRTYGEERRAYWEEKILGLGSPKVDMAARIQREDVELPEEWRRAIQKPDGGWKKVVLYNTSVSALLKYGERMLEKMRRVFGVFEGKKEDIALVWRPHPLIQATIESMRPRLWEEYQRLVEEYREAGWGIYDDSAELDRALAVSDVYYGDWSSLVELCRKIGKPVMIQDAETE